MPSTLRFPSDGHKLAYWNAHKPPGAPAEIQERYLDYLESALEGEDWTRFTERVDLIRSNYERAADVSMAVYGDDKFDVPLVEGLNSALDDLLAKAAPLWRSQSAVGRNTWLRWIQLAPVFHFIPTGLDERTAEFAWSRVRCFLAGAGYGNWRDLATELCETYPACPFDPEDTEEAWNEALLKAHSACGWPAQLAWLNWSKLHYTVGNPDAAVPRWLKMLSLLHVLKHARYSPSQGVVVHLAGVSTIIEPERSNAVGTWGRAKSALLGALGARKPGGRAQPPLGTRAVEAVVEDLDVNNLLRKESLGALPANYLGGPWTMPVPDHSTHDGFFQTGLRLSGVWAARDGKVTKDYLDPATLLAYDWNCKDPAAYNKERDLFSSSLPKEYSKAWPSEVFHDAFPNLDLSWCPGLELAAKALLDVPVAASLVRSQRPEFLTEYPAIVFMPATPSPSDSTNQGKSQAALVYARATNPAITRLVSINDSSSAPDIRTVAGEIRSVGSIAIDEFRPPKNQTHIFAHDNMQALCTGSSVASGRVYENDGTVALRSSPVFSAKVYEVPHDIQNRSLAHWLGPLTDEMRSRSTVLEEIRTGALSLRMRLGMHAILETTPILENYAACGRQSSSRGLRFDAHRTLAGCLLAERAKVSLEEAYSQLDKVIELMHTRMRHHVQLAVDSGLVAAMEFGTALRLRLSYLFDDMGVDEFKKFRATANALASTRAAGPTSGVTPKELLLAWATLRGMENSPYQSFLTVLTGAKRHVSNRAVVEALRASIYELMPAEGSQWIVSGESGLVEGWVLVRGKEDRVFFKCLHPGAAKS